MSKDITNMSAALFKKSRGGVTFVSLGCFCGVAMELERIGLRSLSLPFDWLITGNLGTVLELIKNNFQGFLDPDSLYQEASVNKNYYYNQEMDIHFYHDFSAYQSFEGQIDAVKKKYDRRIQRFYKVIQNPTVFIRYITSKEEVDYLIDHAAEINSFLKSFCSENRILYITDCLAEPLKDVEMYCVKKDMGDGVARHFLKQCPSLERELLSYPNPDKKANLKRYKKSQRKKLLHRILLKLKGRFCRKTYIHNQII